MFLITFLRVLCLIVCITVVMVHSMVIVPNALLAVNLRFHIQDHGRFMCGASLINRPPNHEADLTEGSSDILLTAAHCFLECQSSINCTNLYTVRYETLSAVFGKHNSTVNEDTEVEIKVTNVIMHAKYLANQTFLSNDIAMVKLEKPINFSEIIKPIAVSRFPLQQMTNCSVAGWGRHNDIPGQVDPNAVLSVLNLSQLTAVYDVYVLKVNSWNETIVPGDSGSPMTCWKDGRIFLQGIVSSTSVKDNMTNVGPFKINVKIVVYVVFVDMNHFWRSNWIMDAFQNIDTPSYMWLNLFAQYETDRAKSTKAASNSSTIDYMVDDFYNGFPRGYNRELILPKWDNADYVEKWHSHRIGGQIDKVIDGALDIQDVIGYTKQSDLYKCAIDCYMWNGNRSCILMRDIGRCYFVSKTNLRGDMGHNLKFLAITMKGDKSEQLASESFDYKIVEEISMRPKNGMLAFRSTTVKTTIA